MPRIVFIFLAFLSFLCGNAFGYARSHSLANVDAKNTQCTNLATLITDHCSLTTSFDFGWDAKNQLVRARTKNHSSAAHAYDLTFTHDAEGRRVQKHVVEYQHGAVVSEKIITFVWDGWDLLYERQQLPSGLTTLERKYLWGPDIADGAAGGAGGLLLIQETKGNNTQKIIPLYDGTGHVTALTNLNKDLLASYAYGPFGEKISATGPMANSNPWRWATKYFDEETGLYYFGKRYLDPVTGQWLSRELLGESESLNLYSYCHNDPVNPVDVLGLAERVVTDSNPEIFGTDKEGDGLYFGWPTEEDGLFRGFESTGRFYYQGPFPASQIKEYISSRKRLSLLRDRASLAFKSEGLTQSIQKLQVAQFYTANIAQAAAGVGEATAGIIAEPFTFGVSTVAVVHGADVTGTAVLRSLHGPEIDVQSSTSLAFQFVGFNRKTAEFGDASLSFVVPAAQLTQGASSLLTRTSVPVGAAERGVVFGVPGARQIGNAQIVRMIGTGESISGLINEGKALTWMNEAEHGLVSLTNGQRVLVSGGRDGIRFLQPVESGPLFIRSGDEMLQVRRVLGHTHPSPTGPSQWDLDALEPLGQSKSYLIEVGGNGTTVFRPK